MDIVNILSVRLFPYTKIFYKSSHCFQHFTTVKTTDEQLILFRLLINQRAVPYIFQHLLSMTEQLENK